MKFKLNLTLKELKKRTSKRYFSEIKFIDKTFPAYKNLNEREKLVLLYLTRASFCFEKINLKLENHKNLEFLNYLEDEIKNNNEKAKLTKVLFNAQKSAFSPDSLGNKIELSKDLEKTKGLGFYPENLSVEEFHLIIEKMLDLKMIDEVKKILNQRSVVLRDGELLKAVDYVDYFEEFRDASRELKNALEFCDDKKFSSFLVAQIKALEIADPYLDAEADKIWAKLENSKFEFTITRECYDETMTSSILENEKLSKRLESLGIEVLTKDSLGARVGILNKSGTKFLKKLKKMNEIQSKYMPYSNEYTSKEEDSVIEQKAVDVDLITLTGEEGAYRAGIVLAQNLPNDDKLSVKLGGGRRNVYHRQIRKKSNKKLYKNLICEEQFQYFSAEAQHWATICHENTHSLGPAGELGRFSAILEEFKADMGIYAFLNEFVENGLFTEKQAKQIIISEISANFAKAKPSFEQPHRVRSVMIVNRMITEGAVKFKESGKLFIDCEKVIQTAKEMMKEVIRIQIDKNLKNAEEYINKWFVWTEFQEKVAEIIKKYSKKLNGYLTMPLASLMMTEEYEKELISKLKNIN